MPYEDVGTGGTEPRHRVPPPLPYSDPVTRQLSEGLRRTLIAVVAIVVAATTALLVSTSRRPEKPPGPGVDLPAMPAMALPTDPVSVLPAVTSQSSAAGSPTTTAVRTVATGHHTAPSRTPGRTVATPLTGLTPGDSVGLEVWGMPGVRVRHRDFLGRADPISSSSSPLDRADSTFLVRAGLGDQGCVSLESVNYPGSFLRHRDFVIHLDPGDGTQLFARDATFCPEPVRDGAAISLRASNFPDRAVTLHPDSTLRLDVGPGSAFVVRRPF